LDENELTYHGNITISNHVPIVMKPVAEPIPELWYGTSRRTAFRGAERGAHM